MDIKIFFDKVAEQVYENIYDENSFFHHISIHSEAFPDWKSTAIALVGLSEDRGNTDNTGCASGANEIRKALYALKYHNGNARIADLGNLRNGMNPSETCLRIKEICEILIERGVFVILMGGTHDLDYGQYQAYEKFDKMVSMVCVDAIYDLSPETDKPYKSHLHEVVVHEPNFLFHLSQLAGQSYLNDYQMQQTIDKLHFENVRLGQMRENFTETEPIIRQADLISFDTGAIKRADAPGNKLSNVFGLTGEEACQLAWYAGLNDQLSSFGMYEYNPEKDEEGKTAFVLATMIWYLVEGYNHRMGDTDFNSPNFMRYLVSIGNKPDQLIVFYKSRLSEKWWMEVPYPSDMQRKYERATILPCHYSDYETALNGELPSRWVLMHSKLF